MLRAHWIKVSEFTTEVSWIPWAGIHTVLNWWTCFINTKYDRKTPEKRTSNSCSSHGLDQLWFIFNIIHCCLQEIQIRTPSDRTTRSTF
ncbi:uncharacterized protein LOC143255055 isoform X2 [Tachypleus tridentatus]|uniref:uncharacterized protein LOC143255055 isoform X2 n=1 Tax=Tachypleus tridentatus TaxID=6853 RepID=UPI003FD4D5D6